MWPGLAGAPPRGAHLRVDQAVVPAESKQLRIRDGHLHPTRWPDVSPGAGRSVGQEQRCAAQPRGALGGLHSNPLSTGKVGQPAGWRQAQGSHGLKG